MVAMESETPVKLARDATTGSRTKDNVSFIHLFVINGYVQISVVYLVILLFISNLSFTFILDTPF